ncbi:MAG: hypothetical protein KU29_11280 [Sulfurovum sp. FS06-10]|jgi:hypothetical protein|nr:MAG: hypothetical protein KU29_11280 [Sulfurovum sp. FS06-10]
MPLLILILFIFAIEVSLAESNETNTTTQAMFIDSKQATKVAQKELNIFLTEQDALFAPWKNLSIGETHLVSNLFKKPAYWLVSIMEQKHLIGFIRVMPTGSVVAIGTVCRDVQKMEDCPSVVTGITKEEAQQMALKENKLKENETLNEPIFVYDGSIGKEAWMVEILTNNKVNRWIFITQSGTYSRLKLENKLVDDIE